MSKASRDQKLVQLQANLSRYALQKKAALQAEATWLKKVLSLTGGTVATANQAGAKLGVVDEINEFLK